ncbi:hypothetical protein Tco_0665174 [Tanacetum coccineum]
MLLAKKDSDEQLLLAEDQAWMESSSDSDQEINANMVFMAKMENVLSDSEEISSIAEETIAEDTRQHERIDLMRRLLQVLELRIYAFFLAIAAHKDFIVSSANNMQNMCYALRQSSCMVWKQGSSGMVNNDGVLWSSKKNELQCLFLQPNSEYIAVLAVVLKFCGHA